MVLFRRIGTQRFQSKLLRMASQPPDSFPRKRPHAQYGHGFIQHFATHGPPEPRTADPPSKPCNSGASTGCTCVWTRIAAVMAESTLPRNQIRGCSLVTISVPFRWVCASASFSTLAKGTLLGRQRMHGLAVVTGDAAVTGYDEESCIFLLFTSSCAEGVKQDVPPGKDAVPRPAPGRNGPSNPVPSNTAFRFHVLQRIPLFPPKRGTLIAFSQSPRNGLRDNPLATPSGCPASNLKTVCGHPGKPFFLNYTHILQNSFTHERPSRRIQIK